MKTTSLHPVIADVDALVANRNDVTASELAMSVFANVLPGGCAVGRMPASKPSERTR